MLENPKAISTYILIVKILMDATMGNQQETERISQIMSRILRDYACDIFIWRYSPNILEIICIRWSL